MNKTQYIMEELNLTLTPSDLAPLLEPRISPAALAALVARLQTKEFPGLNWQIKNLDLLAQNLPPRDTAAITELLHNKIRTALNTATAVYWGETREHNIRHHYGYAPDNLRYGIARFLVHRHRPEEFIALRLESSSEDLTNPGWVATPLSAVVREYLQHPPPEKNYEKTYQVPFSINDLSARPPTKIDVCYSPRALHRYIFDKNFEVLATRTWRSAAAARAACEDDYQQLHTQQEIIWRNFSHGGAGLFVGQRPDQDWVYLLEQGHRDRNYRVRVAEGQDWETAVENLAAAGIPGSAALALCEQDQETRGQVKTEGE